MTTTYDYRNYNKLLNPCNNNTKIQSPTNQDRSNN